MVIVGYRAEIILEILVVDRSSPSPGIGRKRKRGSPVPSGHDLKWRQVISTKIKGVIKGNVNEGRVNELKCCVKERKR